MPSPFMAMTDPKGIDKAPIDAFTPLLLLGGMVARSVGTTATEALWGAMVVEAGINASIRQFEPILGARAVPETEINILVDVVAGLVGWFIMDAVIRAN